MKGKSQALGFIQWVLKVFYGWGSSLAPGMAVVTKLNKGFQDHSYLEFYLLRIWAPIWQGPEGSSHHHAQQPKNRKDNTMSILLQMMPRSLSENVCVLGRGQFYEMCVIICVQMYVCECILVYVWVCIFVCNMCQCMCILLWVCGMYVVMWLYIHNCIWPYLCIIDSSLCRYV